LSVSAAAKYVGKAVKTLQRWDRSGRLKPTGRTPSNRRVYTIDQLNEIMGGKRLVERATPSRVVTYCRVSSSAQRPDLKNQRKTLELFCASRGFSDVEFIEEIGGGLNFRRKRFKEIMSSVGRDEVKTLVIAHKDRLSRFGFEWFESFCKDHGCEIVVLNHEALSPEQEMVQDLMTIVHCFSARLYGLRNYRKSLKKAMATAK